MKSLQNWKNKEDGVEPQQETPEGKMKPFEEWREFAEEGDLRRTDIAPSLTQPEGEGFDAPMSVKIKNLFDKVADNFPDPSSAWKGILNAAMGVLVGRQSNTKLPAAQILQKMGYDTADALHLRRAMGDEGIDKQVVRGIIGPVRTAIAHWKSPDGGGHDDKQILDELMMLAGQGATGSSATATGSTVLPKLLRGPSSSSEEPEMESQLHSETQFTGLPGSRQSASQYGRKVQSQAGSIGSDAIADLSTMLTSLQQADPGKFNQIMTKIWSDPEVAALGKQLGHSRSGMTTKHGAAAEKMAATQQPAPVTQAPVDPTAQQGVPMGQS